MAKTNEIIRYLADEQKAELAADVNNLSGTELGEAGIPAVRFAAAEEGDGTYPSYKAMAYSWNKDLLQAVWQDRAASAGRQAEVLISPPAGVCNSPYSGGAAEDPYLAGAYIAAYSAGVKQAGLTPCISCNFDGADVAFMDTAPSDRAFNEYYMLPFTNAAEGSAYMFPYVKYGGAYGDIYTNQVNSFLHKNCKGTVICKDVPDRHIVSCLKSGNLVTGGNADKIKEELSFISSNSRAGGVVDPLVRAVSNAAQNAADFAFDADRIKAAGSSKQQSSGLALEISEQSCVLLKNQNVLPLRRGATLSVIGSLSDDVNAQKFSDIARSNGFSSEWKEGYSRTDETYDGIAETLEFACTADYCIMFLGFDEKSGENSRKTKHTKLPANQLALLSAVAAKGANIIAVINSEYPVDLSFDDSVAAILLCPPTGRYTAQAVYNILSGKTSPSGKLARTWYTDTDERFKLIKDECRGGSRKMGVFAGYRGYGGGDVAYPFGYGLSYSKFDYSGFSSQGSEIKFKVKNRGRAASEVIQIYLGKPDSAIVRPQMELKAFIKVDLKEGESADYSVKFSPKTLQVYNKGNFVSEGGRYSVYIGSSPQDIKLKGSIDTYGQVVLPDGEKQYEYDMSASNVAQGGYTLKPVKQASAKTKPLVTGIWAATGFLFLALLCISLIISGVLGSTAVPYLAVQAIMYAAFIAVIVLIIVGVKKYMDSRKNAAAAAAGADGENINRAVQNPYEKLFGELYGEDEEDYLPDEIYTEKERVRPADQAEDDEEEIEQQGFTGTFDPKVTFADTCGQLNDFFSSRGISMGVSGARKILSSMAASRILVLEGNSPLNGKLTRALGEFFESGNYSCNMAEIPDAESLVSDSGNAFGAAIELAIKNPDDIYIAVLTNAGAKRVESIFTPLVRCAYANEHRRITVGGINTDVPPNIWFVLVPESNGMDYGDLPLCNSAAVLVPELTACDPSGRYSGEKITYTQFMGMLDRLTRFDENGVYALDEDHSWKKIDRLEKYLNGKCGYKLGNKESLSIERFAAVYLACGGEQNDALDGVAASKLTLPLMSSLKDAEMEDGELISKIEGIFDECSDIKKVINTYDFSAAK
ncbi:MAG: glycoside hydrolase family 3 C-terminal domain-containing protein [Clostridia bacterium]|nr:glycoside hydrolase family 3 C-terminal domain-containing protein [Clostridia bacterium]